MKYAPLLALVASPIAANLMIQHIGFDCVPCLLPVMPGVWTASGVYVAGLALAMRDVVHERWGVACAFICVLAGAALSAIVSPVLAFASATAFIACEALDAIVYGTMRHRLPRAWAVMLSGLVGAVADGLLFVWLAFGSLELGAGNVIGKLYASAALAAFWARRRK